MKTLIGVGWLGAVSMVHEGDLLSDLFLETKVGGFLIPEGEGGGYCIHDLDAMHDPSGDPCREVRDQGGGVFHFIVFGADDVQLERIDVFLELLSGIDASGGKPVHGFSGGVGVDKGIFTILLKLGKRSKRQGSQSLLAADFCPYGSGSLLHIGQGEGDFPIIIVVQDVVDQQV